MRKTLVIALLVSIIGTASAFPASMQVIDRKASPDDPGRFEVTLQNNNAEPQIFSVGVSPYSHWFYVDSGKMLEPGENHSFQLLVTPPEDTLQQNYRFDVYARGGEESQKFTDYFTVERPYELSIKSVSADKNSYDPGENVKYRVEVLNTASRKIEDYTVKAELMGKNSSKKGLPLDGGSTGLLTLNLKVPEKASPGNQKLEISINRDGETKQTVEQEIRVKKYEKVERSIEADNRVLFYTKTLTAENQGNTQTEAKINASLADYLIPITSFSSKPDNRISKEESTLYQWNRQLEPGETTSVKYTVRYWIPLSALAAILAGLLLINKLRTDVIITKTSRETEKGIKIHLELENRSSEPLNNLKLKDFVPDVASVNEDFPMAKPVIRKTSNGTRLTWEVEELEPGDQRVFEYTIKPLFEVEGKVTLPSAELEAGDTKIAETSKVEAEFKPRDT